MIKIRPIEGLEPLIDKHTLAEVLFELSAICYSKAEHLRHNCQEETYAQAWERIAARLQTEEIAARKLGL